MSLPPPVGRLLELAASDDHGTKDAAMQQLGLLLEKHSRLANSPGLYESMLRPDLFRLTLGGEEQRELVAGLGALVAAGQLTPNILMWALGTPAAPTALSHLLQLVGERGRELDEETLFETLRAAERFLVPEGGGLPDETAGLVSRTRLVPSLQHLAGAGSARVQELSRDILRKLGR